MLLPWFGPWPEWINFFLESCRWNKGVTWIIVTDQDAPENHPDNCIFKKFSLSEYVKEISRVTGLHLEDVKPYKLCDLRPCLGEVHASDIAEYSHFGYCDLDVIFGNIRNIYRDEILLRYDAISSQADRLAGHFAVFRNSRRMRRLYRKVRGWRRDFLNPSHVGFDEGAFGSYVWRSRFRLPKRPFGPRVLFCEQFATVESTICWPPDGSASPVRWFWSKGVLTNEDYHEQQFLYLHFMRWQSARWRAVGSAAPWECLENVVQMDWRSASRVGFEISPKGIYQLGQE